MTHEPKNAYDMKGDLCKATEGKWDTLSDVEKAIVTTINDMLDMLAEHDDYVAMHAALIDALIEARPTHAVGTPASLWEGYGTLYVVPGESSAIDLVDDTLPVEMDGQRVRVVLYAEQDGQS